MSDNGMDGNHHGWRRRRWSPFAVLAAIAALALVAAACGGDDAGEDTTTTAAPGGGEGTVEEASGSITLYTGRNPELIGDLLEQFTEDTGIEVEVREGDSAELAAQILTEGEASPADVYFSQDAGALGAVSRAGLFVELPAEVLSEVPAAFSAADGTWVGTSGRVRTIVYNPELVPEPPSSIDDLLDPEYAGSIGFAPTNASWQAFVTGLRVLRGEDGALEWLEGFAAQDPVAYEKNGAVRDAVDGGEVAVGLVNHYYLYELIDELGEENVVARNQFLSSGDPGGLVNVAGVGVLASSQNSDAALAFVEYLVGPEGQAYFAERTFEYPLAAGVEPSAELPTLESLEPPELDLSDLESLEQTQELLAQVGLLTR